MLWRRPWRDQYPTIGPIGVDDDAIGVLDWHGLALLTLPGLECIYFFNGASQMDDVALGSAVAQCDAVLRAVAA